MTRLPPRHCRHSRYCFLRHSCYCLPCSCCSCCSCCVCSPISICSFKYAAIYVVAVAVATVYLAVDQLFIDNYYLLQRFLESVKRSLCLSISIWKQVRILRIATVCKSLLFTIVKIYIICIALYRLHECRRGQK